MTGCVPGRRGVRGLRPAGDLSGWEKGSRDGGFVFDESIMDLAEAIAMQYIHYLYLRHIWELLGISGSISWMEHLRYC